MPKLYVIIAVLFFSFYTQAQPSNQNVVELAKVDEAKKLDDKKKDKKADNKITETKVTTETKSKINIPPEKAQPITVPKMANPVVIDGKIDEEIWKDAVVFKDFYQTNPGDNLAPSKPTEVLMMYDEKHLYIAFKCWDDKDKIRATVAKRDEVFNEDNVRLWLDTYNDQRRAYVIGFNPLGIQQDGIFTEGRGSDYTVDIVMESKGVIEDWGWAVEVKIPFKSLRYTAGKGKHWGFNVARNIDRLNDELDQWLPNDRNVTGFLIQHGKITGFDGIKAERTLEIVPSITVSETGDRVRMFPRYQVNQQGYYDPIFNPNGLREMGRFVNRPIKQDIGLTLKYTVTPNVTLDAAYNPDFAEIEADATVVSANQRFPLFFEERRPFFLEGVEIFQTPLQVFYSRTIVDPDLAVKLSGKIGGTSFGFMAASDKAPGNYNEDDRNDPSVRPGIDEFLDKNATFGIVRLKQDIGKQHHVGFFGTYRSFPEQKNLLGGFDGRFQINPKTIFSFQAVGSTSRRCFFNSAFEPTLNVAERDRNREICGGSTFNQYRTGNGIAYFANLDHTAETFGYTIEVGGRSKDYRADAGFNRRTNSNYGFAGVRLSTKNNPKGKIIRVNWFNNFSGNYDFQGRSQALEWGSNLNFALQNNTYLNFNGGIGYERIFEEEFGLRRMPTRPNGGAFVGQSERSSKQAWIGSNFSKQFSQRLSFGVFAGTIFNAFDFDFGGGDKYPRVSPGFIAYQTAYDDFVRRYLLNPNDPTNIEPNYPSQYDPGVGQQYDFEAEVEWKPINPLRMSLSYSKNVLVRKDTDKKAFDSNIMSFRSTYQFTRFVFVRTRVDYNSLDSNFLGQVLAGWNPSPGTAFYVGYNDNFNYNGFNPFTGKNEPQFERNSRSFFIRASYLFRKSF